MPFLGVRHYGDNGDLSGKFWDVSEIVKFSLSGSVRWGKRGVPKKLALIVRNKNQKRGQKYKKRGRFYFL
jgi:hypothetical protein